MARPTAISLITEAKHVALLPVRADDLDAVASAAALAFALQEAGVQPAVYLGLPHSDVPHAAPPAVLKFLGGDFWRADLEVSSELQLTIPNQPAKVSAIWYKRSPTATTINVASSEGHLLPQHVHITAQDKFSADALVTIGAANVRALGERFTKHADVFYRVPILTIAHEPETESFGVVNQIDWTVRSNAEIVYSLLMQWDAKLITPAVATALLTALLAKTESFQKIMTSPEQFDLAATLLEKKADYHTIIQNLFKTKPLSHLQLWGAALSNLQTKAQGRLAWTTIEISASQSQAVQELVSQLLIHTVDAEVVVIFVSTEGAKGMGTTAKTTEVYVATPKRPTAPKLAQALSKQYNGKIIAVEHAHVGACLLPRPLAPVQENVLQTCELFLKPGYTEGQTNGHFPQSKSARPVPAH